MPGWMHSLHSIAGSSSTPAYLRLFLVKMVIHVDRRHADRVALQPEVQHLLAGPTFASSYLLARWAENAFPHDRFNGSELPAADWHPEMLHNVPAA